MVVYAKGTKDTKSVYSTFINEMKKENMLEMYKA
jgi:hypothetical protein